MSKLLLRRANARDADDLADCINAAYSVYADRITDLPAVSEGIEGAIEVHRVWVAQTGQQIAGGMILVAHPDFLMLQNVAVRPEAAGRGIGRALIARAEQDCLDLGLLEIRLSTHSEMPENIAFYSRLGWTETGRSGNTVFMSKRI